MLLGDVVSFIYASDLFEAICGYYGVEVGTYPDVNNDKKLYFYDNTLTGKQYISYLAEIFGGNAKIERDGSCSIIPLKNYTNIEIDTLTSKKLEVGDTYTLTRVCYDNGKSKFQAGGNVIKVEELPTTNIDTNSYYYLTTNMKYYKYINVSETETPQYEWQEATEIKNTLYLRTENLFITQQEDIDNIFETVEDFSITNIECENRIDLSLDAWDIVKFTAGNKEYYSFYDNTVNFNGVTMGTIKVSIPLKNVEETTNITGYTTQSKIRKIQTNIDEQNLTIATIVEDIGDRSQKTTSITQDIDRIESNVQDIEDITEEQHSNLASVSFTDINRSEPIRIIIRPINSNISYLYPRENLYPSDTLYLRDRIIRFTNTTTNTILDYEIPADLLYYDSNNYDEFILDYSTKTCKVIKKCGYNADGTVYVLATPQELTFDYPTIDLADGDYTITINGYNIGYLLVKLMKKNDFTEQFATIVEMNSSITQTADEINLEVRKKVGEDEIISKINQTAEDITIDANRININGTVSANGNFKVDTNGNMEAVNGKFTGGNIDLTDEASEQSASLNISSNDYDAYYMSNGIEFYGDGRVSIDTGAGLTGGSIYVSDGEYPTNNYTRIQNGSVDCLTITQRSLESAKKNFNKLDNAISILKNIDIYKYNLKTEGDNDKQHIGFVIGDNFKYSKEITSKNNDGVDIYSFVSVCCKAIQEQQQEIEKLEKRINELEGGR